MSTKLSLRPLSKFVYFILNGHICLTTEEDLWAPNVLWIIYNFNATKLKILNYQIRDDEMTDKK